MATKTRASVKRANAVTSDVDMVIDDEPTIAPEMVKRADVAAIVADNESSADLQQIARDIVKSADVAATSAASSVPSAMRYKIGKRAAKLMIKHDRGVESVAVMIGIMLEKHAAINGDIVPRVWRDLSGVSHALKCWIPGCVPSAALSCAWPAVKKYPFHALPQHIIDRSTAGMRGYDWGGIICDKWSRIDPRKLADLRVTQQFDELVTDGGKRIDQYAFLDELMPERATKNK